MIRRPGCPEVGRRLRTGSHRGPEFGADRNRPVLQPGFSLLELLVALILSGLVCGALVSAVSAGERLARSYGHRVQIGEAVRVVEAALGGDLRFIDPMNDLRGVGPDSLLLRIFRGAGIVCREAAGAIVVRYRGLRAPEPAKDSILVVDGLGRARAAGLDESITAPAACESYDGERLYRWRLDETVPTGTLLLVFETGAYHLSDDAFRYRRGESGRQPLTAEIIDASHSELRFVAAQGGRTAQANDAVYLDVTLATTGEPTATARSPLRSSVRLRHAILNGNRHGFSEGGEP